MPQAKVDYIPVSIKELATMGVRFHDLMITFGRILLIPLCICQDPCPYGIGWLVPKVIRLILRTSVCRQDQKNNSCVQIKLCECMYYILDVIFPELELAQEVKTIHRLTFFHLPLSNQNRVIQLLYTTSVAHKYRNRWSKSIWTWSDGGEYGPGVFKMFSPTKVASILVLIPLFK